MDLKPITLSFKHTPEEIELYNIISQYSSKGAFIKDTLIRILVRNEVQKNCFMKVDINELLGGDK